jgi:hypothetical protein
MDKKPSFISTALARLFGRQPIMLPNPETTAPAGRTGSIAGYLPETAGEEFFIFPHTPAVEHVFRSIARNPSRYAGLLEAVRAAPPQSRGEIAAGWMRENAPLAWQEARQVHARLEHTFPPRLQSEEELLAALADRWGDSLYVWAERLSRSSPAYQRAVMQLENHVS